MSDLGVCNSTNCGNCGCIETEVARLRARVAELEASNEELSKCAVGATLWANQAGDKLAAANTRAERAEAERDAAWRVCREFAVRWWGGYLENASVIRITNENLHSVLNSAGTPWPENREVDEDAWQTAVAEFCNRVLSPYRNG